MSGRGLKLLPRRISGQIALLLIAALTLTHIIFTVGFQLSEARRDLTSAPHALVGAFITVARMVARTGDATERAQIVAATQATYPALELTLGPATDGAAAPGRGVVSFLAREIGITGVRLVEGSEAGTLRLILGDGTELRARVPFEQMRPPFFGPVQSTLLLIAISLAFIVLWAARWVTKPLSAIARAAGEFSLEGDHEALPEVGPEEVQAVSKAMNRMRERIAGLVGDRTRMLAAVGHDLRTPITRLRLRAEFIEDGAMRRDMLRDLDRMSGMVESALSYLKTGQTGERMASLDLPTLLQTICDGFVDMGETVEYEGPDHLFLSGRVEDLVRAFENVVENAVKYGTRATVRLAAPHDGRVATYIDDDGPGISDEEKVRMIDPFVRGDAARASGDKTGFGLGLSIAADIVAAHGGTIRLADAPGGGLRVVIELPLPVE
ncbi:MAG: ATP-binding protein [Hyphomicrobiales bacterium]